MHDLNRIFNPTFTDTNRRFQQCKTQYWMDIFIKCFHDFIKSGQQHVIDELEDWEDKIRIKFKCYKLMLFHTHVDRMMSNPKNICNIIYS